MNWEAHISLIIWYFSEALHYFYPLLSERRTWVRIIKINVFITVVRCLFDLNTWPNPTGWSSDIASSICDEAAKKTHTLLKTLHWDDKRYLFYCTPCYVDCIEIIGSGFGHYGIRIWFRDSEETYHNKGSGNQIPWRKVEMVGCI